MAHRHSVYDSDSHFAIDPITRTITNKSSRKTTLIQYDHNSERFTFEIPRYVEGHDMSTCNAVEIHYLNIEANTRLQNEGAYTVDDMQISPEDEEVVICSWLISQNATRYIGSLNFIVRFACLTDGVIDYAWNTAVYSGIAVSSGIYNSEIIVEQYEDVLEKWKAELNATMIIDDLKQTQTGYGDGDANIWTATFRNGRTSNLIVRNGSRGIQGEQGIPGVSGVYVGSGNMPEGYNVQIDPNGTEVYVEGELKNIYGVDGVGGSNITRTDDAVGLEYTVGESEIHSDFSNHFPWANISEVCLTSKIYGNSDKVQATSYDRFVKIPKFYSRITKNADGTYKHQISGTRHTGFSTLFIDGNGNEIDYVLVGKYEAYVSHPSIDGMSTALAHSTYGRSCTSGLSITDARKACKIHGKGFQQYDIWINAIIQELFLIEFATTDCQSIMAGYTNGNAAFISTGETDTVPTPSGSYKSNTSGNYSCKYRGIENLWGNYWHFIDGVTFEGNKIYVSKDPSSYGNYIRNNSDYVCVGTKDNTVGTKKFVNEMKQFEYYPLLGFPVGFADTVEGANYHGAYYTNGNGTGEILVGSWHKSSGKRASLWSYNTCDVEDFISSAYGFRLCYKPIK